MEIPAIQNRFVDIAVPNRDYSPMARATAAKQAFFQQAFQAIEGVAVPINNAIQNNRLRERQNDAMQRMANGDKEYRDTVTQMRVNGAAQTDIDEYTEKYRNSLFNDLGRDLVAPGNNMRFQQWAEDKWLSYSIESQTKINTELMALNQYNANNERDRLIDAAGLANAEEVEGELRTYHAQLVTDGIYSPVVSQKLLDEDIGRMNASVTYDAAMQMYEESNSIDAATNLINGAELDDGVKADLVTQITDYHNQRRDAELKQVRNVATLQHENVLQTIEMAMDPSNTDVAPPPTATQVQNMPQFQADDPEVQQRKRQTMEAVNVYWNSRVEANESARNEAIEANDAAMQQSARDELATAYSDPNVSPFEYRQKVFELWRDAGLSETDMRTRLNAATQKNMTPELRSAYEVLTTSFQQRIQDAERDNDMEEVNRLTQEKNRYIDEFYRLRTSDFYSENELGLADAMQKLVQNSYDEDLANTLSKYTNLSYENDTRSYQMNVFGDALRSSDVESIQAAIDNGDFIGQVQAFRPQLNQLRDGYERLLTQEILPDARMMQPPMIDDYTGRPTFLYDYDARFFDDKYAFSVEDAGSQRQGVAVSFQENNKDTQLVVWNPQLKDWEAVDAVSAPELFQAARGLE